MIDNAITVPRDAVLRFAARMEERLRANDHKPGWSEDYLADLASRIDRETAELRRALKGPELFPGSMADNYSAGQLQVIIKEAADVANFAMMIADNAQHELDEQIREAREA